MDLEGPESQPDTTANDAAGSLSWIDAEWHTASRRARWMDLLGDYAGIEPFIIDGNSLIQHVIDDPLLALGKSDDPSFQILHAFHTLERTLNEFVKRSAVFDVVFWDETRYAVLGTGASKFQMTSRSLARRLLFNHLLKIPQVDVYVFSGLSDPKWREYHLLRKPMFVLVNDGGPNQDSADPFAVQRHLCYRVFLYDLLTNGLALALLNGAEFRDSKVLSFVYESESRRKNDFIPPNVRAASLTAGRILEEETTETVPLLLSSSIEPVQTLTTTATEDVALEVASLIRFSDSQEKALFFAFLVHLVLLPHLSTQDRARQLEPMSGKSRKKLPLVKFLPDVFRAVEMAITSSNTTVDVDARVFVSLVRFMAENHTLSMRDVLGKDVAKTVADKLSAFSVPISAFSQFSKAFLPSQTLGSLPNETRFGLLPFSNKIFDHELASIHGCASDDDDDDEAAYSDGLDWYEWEIGSKNVELEKKSTAVKLVSQVPRTGYFDSGTPFNDKKTLLPKHFRDEKPRVDATEWQRKKRLRSDQRFMKTLHDQAATLTGASGAALHQIKIPSVGTGSNKHLSKSQKQNYVRPKASKGTQKQSKADAIRETIRAEKAQKQLTEYTTWLTERIRDLDSESSMLSLEKTLVDLKRNPKSNEPFVAAELALYRLHRSFQHWILDPKHDSVAIRDKHSVTALRTIKDILEMNYSTSGIRECVRDILNVLGLSAYTNALQVASKGAQDDRPLSFKFVKLVRSETQELLYPFMRSEEHPIEWQLRVFGEFMDRSMDSQADPRVPFKPDAWQRRVLDAVDDNKSLLVVAPTSAGKTFISYYAMEKVLRGSDEDVIVYVAPTKALVAQVAAEIYARFSKDLNGRSCWAIHTRDYRIHDPQNCQILVTVPEILSIMMLSPPLAKAWTPRLKYIILDEIHTIGQQEGGSVWERILLLAPCPIIGLSATVGAPEEFNTWLEAVQKAGNFQHTFVHHPHRYSHLRKFFYNLHEKPRGTFESITTHNSTGRMRYLHPISMLAFGPRSIPFDLALEAADTLTLYRAFAAYGDMPRSTLDALYPLKFFPADRLLQQRDVIAYDEALKACLAPMVAEFDPRDTMAPLNKIISGLEDSVLSRVPTKVINAHPKRATFVENLIHLVCDLHVQGDLPAIFFNFDRTECEVMADHLCLTLIAKEEEWRDSNPEWQRKLAQYEMWLSRAKDRERAAKRAAKNIPDPHDAKTETFEWQATFDLDAPLAQFSFAGRQTSYTQGMLEEDLKDLARWTSTPKWAFSCLKRGIAVHHSGMNRRYRSVVESLFRRGFVRVIFATGTLALGINAPIKTSVFCGDSPFLTALMYRQCAGRAGRRGYDLLGKVVFYGLPMDRVQRLTLSKLPLLGVSFPVTSTLILCLFNLLDGSNYAPAAVNAVTRLFRLPRVSFGTEEGKHQLLHHLRFSIDYLQRSRLLDEHGRPLSLFGIASNCAEPGNFALVTLLRHGVIHKICAQSSVIQAKRDFILLMCHLFGRRYLPGSYLKDKNVAGMIKKSASMVILPPVSDGARKALAEHEEEILRIFTGYALTYASERRVELGPDVRLPLSGIEIGGTPTFSAKAQFGTWLRKTASRVVARSSFVANSGHDDRFESVADLARTARTGLSLNEHAIPSFAPIFGTPGRGGHWADERHKGNRKLAKRARRLGAGTQCFPLNAYVLDFYTHGQVRPLSDANAIRRGDVWTVLQEFDLTLKAVKNALEQLITRKGEPVDEQEGSDTDEHEGESDGWQQDLDGNVEVDDSTEEENGQQNDNLIEGGKTQPIQVKPRWVTMRDWRVLEVVREVTKEFDEKFRAIWA